jgi:predicted RNA-binding Zn-ribbon protein involved in translation (DUF1610 family)
MTRVRTSCHGCNDAVDVPAEAILLRHLLDAEEGSYTFQCPECGAIEDKPASATIAAILLTAGASYVEA